MSAEGVETLLAEAIAAELTRSGFFGWLLSNGDSALWAERTPEQEMGRVAAKAGAAVLVQHIDGLLTTARAEGAAEVRERVEAVIKRPSPETMSDAEGDAWDALHDDTNIICTCDGCNFYSPTYDDQRECSLNAHIEGVVSARIHAATLADPTAAEVRP